MRALAALILATVVAVGFVFSWIDRTKQQLHQPLVTTEQTLQVKPGTVLPRLLQDLAEQGWIEEAPDARILARLRPELTQLKAGTYAVPDTLLALLQTVVSGQSINYFFTIVPGWNLWQLQAALQADARLQQTLPGDVRQWHTAFDYPGLIEGRFLPDTYAFAPGASDHSVLKRAYDAMNSTLAEAWRDRSSDQLKSPDELLIMASIVEKETAVASERALVAGVFEHRLQRKMRLQTDPTVIYGLLPEFDGNIRKRDLQAKTPYNTYVIRRLPPTPIAMPSQDSLNAAAQPAPTDYLYFVADGEGGHAFGRTLAEHQANVRAYLKQRRANR